MHMDFLLFAGVIVQISALSSTFSVTDHVCVFSTSGGYHRGDTTLYVHRGDTTLYVCSVHRGDTMSTLGDTMSTSGGYHEYIGDAYGGAS